MAKVVCTFFRCKRLHELADKLRSALKTKRGASSFHKVAEAGFVGGQNAAFVYRWAEGRYDLSPALAAELVNRKVDCIVAAGGPPTVVAAKAATTRIPIVFIANNPVELAIVASLDLAAI
jgi:ABC-type uncharacterized transport system substrate-binding protein